MSVCVGIHCGVIFFPEKPFNIRLEGGVSFTWGESTGVVDGYRIYWGESQGGPYPYQLCDVNGTTLNYTTVLENHKYYLICRAYNEVGESGNSNEVYYFNN